MITCFLHKPRISMLAKLLLLPVIAQLLGCTANYAGRMVDDTLTTLHLKNQHTVLRESDWRLPMNTKLFLARPQFDAHITANSDQLPRNRTMLHAALEKELLSYFPRTHVAWADLGFEEALTIARLQGSEILVYPLFVTYSNHLNSWAELNEGKGTHPNNQYGRDQALFEILLVETYSGDILDSATISSHERLFENSDQPQTLYAQAAQRYVLQISGRRSHTERPR